MPSTGRSETGKRLTSPRANAQAVMAHLRGVCCGDDVQHDARKRRLVGHKLPQLVKRPAIASPAFLFASGLGIRAVSNACQVFQGQRSISCRCRLNKRFGDVVVDGTLKPFLTPRQPVQELTATTPGTPGALRGFLLQYGPQSAIPITDRRQLLSAPVVIVTGVCNVRPTQIDPEHIGWALRGRKKLFDLDVDGIGTIPVLAPLGAGGLVAFELPALVVAEVKAEVDPAMQQGETHAPVAFSERENPLVILNARGIERFDNITVGPSGFPVAGDTPKSLLGEIRGQSRATTHIIVEHGLH